MSSSFGSCSIPEKKTAVRLAYGFIASGIHRAAEMYVFKASALHHIKRVKICQCKNVEKKKYYFESLRFKAVITSSICSFPVEGELSDSVSEDMVVAVGKIRISKQEDATRF